MNVQGLQHEENIDSPRLRGKKEAGTGGSNESDNKRNGPARSLGNMMGMLGQYSTCLLGVGA